MFSGIFDRRIFVPALIGAALSLFLIRSGFLSFFFLVPLGVLCYRYEFRIAWAALLFAVLGNLILALGSASARGLSAGAMGWDILYFTVMVSVFTWIIAPPPGLSIGLSGSMRLMAGSCLGALVLTGIFFRAASSPGFSEFLGSISSLIDVNIMKSVVLRGGSLVSCVMLFFFCRVLSHILARISLRERAAPSLIAFHVYPAMIWVLSVSLFLLVFARVTRLEVPEIILWNVLIFCAILYLAQGLGILQFFLAGAAISPFLRLAFVFLFIVLLLSPVVNAVLLLGLVLLGIAENWVPFRAPKSNGPPSTPEAL